MAILTLGTKKLLVNDPTVFPVTVTGTTMVIEGFGTFTQGNIAGTIIANRGISGQKQQLSVAAATAAQITMGTVTEANMPVRVVFSVNSSLSVAEFSRDSPHFGDQKVLHLTLNPGDTAAIFLKKIHDQIQLEREEESVDVIGSTFAANKLTFILRENYLSMSVKVQDDEGQPSGIVIKFAPVEDQAGYEGLGVYETLLTERMFTDVTTAPFSDQGLQLPQKGAKYASISFASRTKNEEVYSYGASDSELYSSSKFMLYIRESADTLAYRTTIINFLAASSAPIVYYKGTAAAPQTVVADKTAFDA